jgi:hypothetical protein
LIPKFPKRDYRDKRDNIFETRAIGIGAAKEEEEEAKQMELKKRQVILSIHTPHSHISLAENSFIVCDFFSVLFI